MYNAEAVASLRASWRTLKGRIEDRLRDFRRVGREYSEQDLFGELAFCLFTPQSKATSCWATVNLLKGRDLLLKGSAKAIARELNRVRFRNNKAAYVVEARRLFTINGRLSLRGVLDAFPDAAAAREWLVANVRGLGYKEASHFLRNIGRGEDIAILDRHILRNLQHAGAIRRIPPSLGKKTYLEIEKKMMAFADTIGIPPSHIDLLMWCKETGEIFK